MASHGLAQSLKELPCGERHRLGHWLFSGNVGERNLQRPGVHGQIGRGDGGFDTPPCLRHECGVTCQPDCDCDKLIFRSCDHFVDFKMRQDAGTDALAMSCTQQRYYWNGHVECRERGIAARVRKCVQHRVYQAVACAPDCIVSRYVKKRDARFIDAGGGEDTINTCMLGSRERREQKHRLG